MKKFSASAFLLFVFMICNAKADERVSRKSIVLQIPSLPTSFDPVNIRFMEHFMLLQAMCQSLIRIDEGGNLVGELAESWQLAPDGKKIHFWLKPNAKFSNGTIVIADDVAWSISRHLVETNKSAIGGYLSVALDAEGVSAVGKNEIVFNLKHKYSQILYALGMPGFCITPKGYTFPKQEIVGSGPMYIEKVLGNNSLKLSSSFLYSKTPDLLSIELQSFDNFEHAEEDLEKERVDAIIGAPVSKLKELKLSKKYTISYSESLAVVHLYLNSTNILLKNREFRKDLMLSLQKIAWDKEALVPGLTPQNTFLPHGMMPASYYLRKNEVPLTAPQFKAKWAKTYRNAKPLRFWLIDLFFSAELAKKWQEFCDEVKLPCKINFMNQQSLVSHLNAKDYDLFGSRYVSNSADPNYFLDVFRDGSGLRFGVFSTNQLLKKIAKNREIENQQQRLEMYAKDLIKFESDRYVFPLYRLKVPIIHNKAIRIPLSNFRYEAELWKMKWQK